MKIAIVGAGPAGCHLAHLLADSEHEILLFDHRVGYEKPCGGGLAKHPGASAEWGVRSSAGDSPR